MTTKMGTALANIMYDEIRERIKNRPRPTLAIIQVGSDEASNIYIKYKKKACDKLDFGFIQHKFNDSISTDELIFELKKINNDSTVTGIIVQLPLPPHIDTYLILNNVDPYKDVDCFHTHNIGKLYLGRPVYIPATVMGIYRLLKHHKVETQGKLCVIIGKSNIVGKPLQLLLSDENDMACTTVLCDKYTNNLTDLTRKADILIVAAGVHHLIKSKDDIKEGATVIDVGIHRVDKKIQGDVNYDALKDKAGLITPVPGGVGPLTVASLMWNLTI